MTANLRHTATVVALCLSLLLVATSSHAQEVVTTATQEPSPSESPSPSPVETTLTSTATQISTAATATPVPTGTSPRLISSSFELVGTVIEVTDTADKPTRTLVELQVNGSLGLDGEPRTTPETALISVMTAADGSFAFENIPAGKHVLWVWGGTTFLNVQPLGANKGVFLAEVSVGSDGSVRGAIPEPIRITEKPPGVMGFPVRSGTGAFRVFEESVNVRQALAARTATLPGTGVGDGHRSLRWLTLALGLALLGGTGASWAGARKRRS